MAWQQSKPAYPMKLCSIYGSTIINKETHKTSFIIEAMKAIKKCTGWSPVNPKELPELLGEGSYGLVVGEKLKSKRFFFTTAKQINVAIKIQTASEEELPDIQRELDYATKLGVADLGPKIYKQFYYPLKNEKGERKPIYRVVFIMERGVSADNILYGGFKHKIPAPRIANIVRQMFEIIEKTTEQNIFCRDIKVNNFIVLEDPKTKEYMVRMIDFGGDFCRNLPPIFIHEIRKYAREQKRATTQPKLRTIHATIEKADEDYPKYLFSRVLQVSLILQIFNAMMNQLTRMGSNFRQMCLNATDDEGGDYCTYIKTVLAPAVPIVDEVCSTHTPMLHNITESIIHSDDLYRVFMHYLNPKKLMSVGMLTPSRRREIVLQEFKRVCLIDKWLRGEPRSKPQPKPGKRAAISRWWRVDRTKPKGEFRVRPMFSTDQVTSLDTISLSTKGGGRSKRKKVRR